MSGAFSVRRAQATDLPRIFAVIDAEPDAPHWTRRIWEEIVVDETGAAGERVVLLMEETASGSPMQLAGLTVASRAADAGELETVFVAQRFRRQGLARQLCLRAMRWAAERGATVMQLEVRVSNASAVALYRKLGFAEVGRRMRYYRDPPEDAVLMSASLG